VPCLASIRSSLTGPPTHPPIHPPVHVRRVGGAVAHVHERALVQHLPRHVRPLLVADLTKHKARGQVSTRGDRHRLYASSQRVKQRPQPTMTPPMATASTLTPAPSCFCRLYLHTRARTATAHGEARQQVKVNQGVLLSVVMRGWYVKK
jgi:hypothetical protein